MKICKSGLHQFEGKQCKICQQIKKKQWEKINNDIVSFKNKERSKAWQKANINKVKENNKAWHIANLEKEKAVMKTWNKNNIDKRNASNAKRRAIKLQRTPKWLTKEHYMEIKTFYTKAKELEELDGIKRHVDHIVPLQNEIVSGLHVPWNLQVITATENLEKANKLLESQRRENE